jgi:hypothetical protein
MTVLMQQGKDDTLISTKEGVMTLSGSGLRSSSISVQSYFDGYGGGGGGAPGGGGGEGSGL